MVESVASVPDRPALDGLDSKWSAEWERSGVYHFHTNPDCLNTGDSPRGHNRLVG
jgi:hypothetical protein